MATQDRYEFGAFVLDVAERRLSRRGQRVPLPPKTFDVLLSLVRRAGHLITKQQLLELVWPDAFVEEGILAVHIASLRKALGDTHGGQHAIETVSRFGYRFTHDVRPRTEADPTPHPSTRRGDSSDDNSIAVLPFVNVGANAEHEYFSDGLTEEIIHRLAAIPHLRVIARTSAFAFKNTYQDVRRIADALGVSSVLEGSVRKSGSRVRVAAQLIKAEDGTHLWSGRYEREMTDIFAVQDALAHAIVSALKLQRPPTPAAPRRYVPKLAAFDAYLKALYYQRKLTPAALAQSQDHFERAAALDPDFALARSERGRYFFTLVTSDVCPAHEGMPLVRAAAMEALAIDPSLPEAHALLGLVATTYDYNWAESDRRFRLASHHDQVPPSVNMFYGIYLAAIGRVSDSILELERALQIDPLDLVGRAQLAAHLELAGRTDEAFAQLRHILACDDTFWLAHFLTGTFLGLAGRFVEALPCAERAHALAPWFPPGIGLLAGLFERADQCDAADRLVARLRSDDGYGAHFGWCILYLLRSNVDQAAESLEKVLAQRHPRALLLLCGPIRRIMQSSQRWPALARMINLPDGQEPAPAPRDHA